MDMKTQAPVRAAIKAAIISSGQTIPAIAAQVGVTPKTLYTFLRGTAAMRAENIERLKQTLELS